MSETLLSAGRGAIRASGIRMKIE